VQLIVGDKRVNVTMKAKGAMIVIIALKGEELHKAGLPSRYIEIRWVNARARCSFDEHEYRAGGVMLVLVARSTSTSTEQVVQ